MRTGALAEAHALRETDAARALELYVDHADEIDASDVETVRWLAQRSRPVLEPRLRPVVERALAHADPATGGYLGHRLAATAWYEGRVHEAERRWREILASVRGLGGDDRLRQAVTSNLALVLENQGRCFEAWLLHSRVAAEEDRPETLPIRAFAQIRSAACLFQLGEVERAVDLLDAVEARLTADLARTHPHLPWAAGTVRHMLLDGAAEHARAVEVCDRLLDSVRADTPVPPVRGVQMLRLESLLEVAPERGEELLEELLAVGRGADLDDAWLRVWRRNVSLFRWRIAVHEHDVDGASSAAADLLVEIEAVDEYLRDTVEAGLALLERLDLEPAVADGFLDLATDHCLRCLRYAREDAVRLPELEPASREARDVLERHQARLARRHGRLLDRLEARWRPGEPQFDAATFEDHVVRVCAWCLRVFGRDGVWATAVEVPLVEDTRRLTHSICGACSAREFGPEGRRARLAGRRPGREAAKLATPRRGREGNRARGGS